MMTSILIGAVVFFVLRWKDIKATIEEYKQFKYEEESLSTEERMRIRGIL